MGIDINGATVESSDGIVLLAGRGGTDAAGPQYGVYLHGGSNVIGGNAAAESVIVRGTGGKFGPVQSRRACRWLYSDHLGWGRRAGCRQRGTGPGSLGIQLGSSATISSSAPGGDVSLAGDSMQIDETVSISAPDNVVTLAPQTSSVAIDLGSTTDAAPNTLELSDAELDRVAAGTLQIGLPRGADPTALNDTLQVGAPVTIAGNLAVSAQQVSINALTSAQGDILFQTEGVAIDSRKVPSTRLSVT